MCSFRFLRYLELIQNHLKPKGPTLDFFRYCETLFFQLNRTAVHFLGSVRSFQKFHLVKVYSPAFIADFGL